MWLNLISSSSQMVVQLNHHQADFKLDRFQFISLMDSFHAHSRSNTCLCLLRDDWDLFEKNGWEVSSPILMTVYKKQTEPFIVHSAWNVWSEKNKCKLESMRVCKRAQKNKYIFQSLSKIFTLKLGCFNPWLGQIFTFKAAFLVCPR